jgi:hypothetical protein
MQLNTWQQWRNTSQHQTQMSQLSGSMHSFKKELRVA